MLEKIIQKNTEKSEISEQLKGLREQLTLLENKIKTAGVPVIITFDGWSAAGKGSMIAKLIRSLDPRFYKVVSYRAPSRKSVCHGCGVIGRRCRKKVSFLSLTEAGIVTL